MNIVVRDAQLLSRVSPLELATYLRASGWSEVRRQGDKASIWGTVDGNGASHEVLVPLRTDLGDYAARIADTLEVLSSFSGRSQLQLLNDLSVANSDVVRIRAVSRQVEDGTILLRDGVALFHHSLDMMMAAASSAVDFRPVFLTRKPDRAVEYLEGVRLGQTERGSFILTILSPVAPQLQAPVVKTLRSFSTGDDIESLEPFERRVTRLLARSVLRVQRAAVSAATNGGLEAFQEAVKEGVTSNLCEALVGLHESCGEGQIELSFGWSRGRTVPANTPSRVIVSEDIIPYVREAAKFFRQTAPPDESEIQGFVTKLSRPRPNARGGEITIHGFIERNVRQVKVRLAHEDYQEAVIAHEKYRPVACRGDLTRSGNVLRLTNPVGFVVLSANQFDAGAFRPSRVRSRRTSPDQTEIEF